METTYTKTLNMIDMASASQLEGTPWSNDREIFDFIDEVIAEGTDDMSVIKETLLINGLREDYAEKIMREYLNKNSRAETKKATVGEIIVELILTAIIVYLAARYFVPWVYSMSPSLGRFAGIFTIMLGLSLVKGVFGADKKED